MTNLYFLWVAIKICGSRRRLAELTGIDVDRISEWLSGSRAITLKNAIKIEKATGGKVNRAQLISDSDKKFRNELKAEVEILQRSTPSLIFKQRVELGMAHETVLGCRKGARTDLSPRENFPEVRVNFDNLLNKKPVLQGRTEELAAELAGFGNYKTYQQAKKVVKNGVPELSEAVDQGLSILRALKISEYSPEQQRYFLSLDRSSMSKALCEAEGEKGADKWKQINSSKTHARNNTEEKPCPRCESFTILALFQAGLFQERKRKEIVDEQNQNTEAQIVLQSTI